ncbi:uncharacterized protein LOC110901133 [Helianthus annuus]|uniref:uncharacterized protein LOC110901133 n=1 Tax=Helianthus annuus TaxID=4232 RepID=UPI000B8F1FFB|nr:uncharacterized protein LOC110901133 [Helianthus annuus]
MYASCSFLGKALSWWNAQVRILGEDAAYGLTWNELKEMLLKEYCLGSELQKIKTDFWNLTMEGLNVRAYTTRFNDLPRLVPRMVTPDYVKIERYEDSRKQKFESSWKDSDEKREKKRSSGKAFVANTSGSGKNVNSDDKSGSMMRTQGDKQRKCARCGRSRHVTRECYANSILDGVKLEGCFECGEQGPFKQNYPKMKGQSASG